MLPEFCILLLLKPTYKFPPKPPQGSDQCVSKIQLWYNPIAWPWLLRKWLSHETKSCDKVCRKRKCKITDRKRIVETSIASSSGFKMGNINMKRFKILKEKKSLSLMGGCQTIRLSWCFIVCGGWERWLRIQYRKLWR